MLITYSPPSDFSSRDYDVTPTSNQYDPLFSAGLVDSMWDWPVNGTIGIETSSTGINTQQTSTIQKQGIQSPPVSVNDIDIAGVDASNADPGLENSISIPFYQAKGLDSQSNFGQDLPQQAIHAHPSLPIFPDYTSSSLVAGSRFRQLLDRKLAAEAGQSATPSSLFKTPQPPQTTFWSNIQGLPQDTQRQFAQLRGADTVMNPSFTSAYTKGEGSGSGEQGKSGGSQHGGDDQRPATSEGFSYPKPDAPSNLGRYPASAAAGTSVPLPPWQTPGPTHKSSPHTSGSTSNHSQPLPNNTSPAANYQTQPNQSAYFQRMLAAKLAGGEEEQQKNGETNSAYPGSILNNPEMAMVPSAYSPYYQVFQPGYGHQHPPSSATAHSGWSESSHQTPHSGYPPYNPSDPNASGPYVGAGANAHPGSQWSYPGREHYTAEQHAQWAAYYASHGRGAPGYGEYDPYRDYRAQGGQGDFQDWMSSWGGRAAPGDYPPYSARPGTDGASTSRASHFPGDVLRDHSSYPESSRDGTYNGPGEMPSVLAAPGSAASVAATAVTKEEQQKKASLACHFCRGRKLKCDGIRPTCAHCAKRGLDCSYDAVIRRRGPGKRKKELMAQQAARLNGETYIPGEEEEDHKPKKQKTGKKTGETSKSDTETGGKSSRQLDGSSSMPPESHSHHAHAHGHMGYGGPPADYASSYYGQGGEYGGARGPGSYYQGAGGHPHPGYGGGHAQQDPYPYMSYHQSYDPVAEDRNRHNGISSNGGSGAAPGAYGSEQTSGRAPEAGKTSTSAREEYDRDRAGQNQKSPRMYGDTTTSGRSVKAERA